MLGLQMLCVEQRFAHPTVHDVNTRVRREIEKLDLSKVAGKSVGITAGSRGIPNIRRILLTIVTILKEAGAKPFIVPCMGSHGGATAKGQKGILEEYGITEGSMRCRIKGAMDVLEIGQHEGEPIFWSKNLVKADFVLIVNRIKPHTTFHGGIESGLSKMIAIGGGRKHGAETIHARARTIGMEAAIVGAARQVLENCRILGGIGIIDNAYHQTGIIEAVTDTSPEGFVAAERALLEQAKGMLPQIPFVKVDVLYLREMGKNVSGSGSDPNVIGRKPGGWRRDELPRESQAEIGHVCCSALTTESHGNAGAIGLHDAVTQRLIDRVDWHHTRLNAEVSGAVDVLFPPPIYTSDEAMLRAALERCRTQTDNPRVVFARNTNDLHVLYISDSLREEAEANSNIQIIADPAEVVFNDKGYLELHFEVQH